MAGGFVPPLHFEEKNKIPLFERCFVLGPDLSFRILAEKENAVLQRHPLTYILFGTNGLALSLKMIADHKILSSGLVDN